MDGDFKPGFSLAGDSVPLFQPAISTDVCSDEMPFNSVFSDGTLQTLIPLPSDFSIGTSSLFEFPAYYRSTHPPSFTFFPENFNTMNQKHHYLQQLGDNSSNSFSQLIRSNFVSESFKIPKQEPISLFNPDESTLTTELTQPLNFFSENLPVLQSLESPSSKPPSFESLFNINLNSNPQNSDSIVDQGLNIPDNFISQPQNPSPASTLSTSVIPQKQIARQRRRSVSDKFRSLQKLLPLDKKMDTATMLGEAHKYIKFLQAQVKALQTMPTNSSFNGDDVYSLGSVFGEIEMLNRQQLLQVLLNTPEAQIRLYSQGCCVYSIEQLVVMKIVAERKAAFHQQMMMFDTRRNS